MDKFLQIRNANEAILLTQYGLSSHKQPPPVSDHLGLTFWVVAYGRFDCNYLSDYF